MLLKDVKEGLTLIANVPSHLDDYTPDDALQDLELCKSIASKLLKELDEAQL